VVGEEEGSLGPQNSLQIDVPDWLNNKYIEDDNQLNHALSAVKCLQIVTHACK